MKKRFSLLILTIASVLLCSLFSCELPGAGDKLQELSISCDTAEIFSGDYIILDSCSVPEAAIVDHSWIVDDGTVLFVDSYWMNNSYLSVIGQNPGTSLVTLTDDNTGINASIEFTVNPRPLDEMVPLSGTIYDRRQIIWLSFECDSLLEQRLNWQEYSDPFDAGITLTLLEDDMITEMPLNTSLSRSLTFTPVSTGTKYIKIEGDRNGDFQIVRGINHPVDSVAIDAFDTNLLSGSITTVSAGIVPASTYQDVNWASSDTTVASVNKYSDSDSYYIKAIKPGTATITATSVLDNTKTVSVTVSVVAKDFPLLTPVEGTSSYSSIEYYTIPVTSGIMNEISWIHNTSGFTGRVSIRATDASGTALTSLTSISPLLFTSSFTGDAFIYVDGERSGNYQISRKVGLPVTGISISGAEAPFTSGSTYQLSAAVTPADNIQSVTWVSSDSGVANISEEGLVEAKHPGTATITVTSIVDGTQTDSVTVTVVGKEFPVLIPIAGTSSNSSMEYYAIPVTSGNVNEISWIHNTSEFSGRVSIRATDASGTALTSWTQTAPFVFSTSYTGEALICVDGMGTGGYQISRKVSLPVTGISISGAASPLTSGEHHQLTAIVTPAENIQSVTWSSSDSDIVSVSADGFIDAKRPGTAIITATSAADPTKSDTLSLTVNAIQLTENVWNNFTIEDRSVTLFEFSAATDSLYYIQANDLADGDGAMDSNITMAAYNSDFSTVYYQNDTSSYTDPMLIVPLTAGSVYLEASAPYSYSGGSAGLRYTSIPAPVSISLSAAEAMSPQESRTLSPSVLPSQTIQDVTWTSSDLDVASVSSEGVVLATHRAGTATITATSAVDAAVSASCVITVAEPVKNSAWTVIYYSDADNDLEAALLSDIQEMKNGLQEGADINIIVLIDRINYQSSDSAILGENFTDTRLYRILPGKYLRLDGGIQFSEITTSSSYEANMGDPGTLQKFIQYCKINYPADNYALFLSNHGSGARSVPDFNFREQEKAICYDETDGNDPMYTAEITDILTSADSVDLMAFDACLMATVEVAYQYRPGTGDFSADYLLASAPNVWGAGFAYEAAFARLNASGGTNGETDSILGGPEQNVNPLTMSAVDFAAVIMEEQKDDSSAHPSGQAQSLTLMDLSAVAFVKTSTDVLAVSLWNENMKTQSEAARGSYSSVNILNYFNSASESEWLSYPYFDLYDLADTISNSTSFSNTVQANALILASAADAMILYSFGNSSFAGFTEGQNGVTIFFPDGDRQYGSPTTNNMFSYQWWYNAIDTTILQSDFLYGKLAWCIDGVNQNANTVGNWFELMDCWFEEDTANAANGGYNSFQW